MKKKVMWVLLLVLLMSGCSKQEAIQEKETVTQEEAVTVEMPKDMFSERDGRTEYEEKVTTVRLTGDGAECNSDAVSISERKVTITDEGTYVFEGSLTDGQIIVNADKQDKTQLVLRDVNISHGDSAPVYIRQADKVFITLEGENTISAGDKFTSDGDTNIDAALFSKEDLSLNGDGSLTINSPGGHGIVSKDDLVLSGGKINVTAAAHGISGKNSVRVRNTVLNATTGKDGIHGENKDDTSQGFVYIESGSFTIKSEGDGISSALSLQIMDGKFEIVSAGGAENAAQHYESFGRPGGYYYEDTDGDDVSGKGLKGASVSIADGEFELDCADDAVHSNGALSVANGAFRIATGDDGMHADETLKIGDGSIAITESYEGLEGLSIELSGADIQLTSSDDGLNAAGGNDQSGFGGPRGNDGFGASSDSYIRISGGTLDVNAEGDGIDSNGDLTISGGKITVAGPTSSGNGALDYGGSADINGGEVIVYGSLGMVQNFSSATQGVIMVSQSGSEIKLADSDGKVLLEHTATKSFSSLILSHPDMKQGETYTLTIDGNSTDIALEDIIYGSSGGMGGAVGHGGQMQGHGGMGGQMQSRPSGITM